DPSNAFGKGRTWQALDTSFAFTVTGTLNCSGSIAGLSFSEKKGVVKAGASGSVTVSFAAGNIAAGNYTTALCVTGNDPVHPLITVPVSVTVSAATSNKSSSGGGGLGLIVLFGLGLAGMRRRWS
ncbi:MAG: hypothetical protein ACRETO_05645, partial [Gammaproteobacteria bacterium]